MTYKVMFVTQRSGLCTFYLQDIKLNVLMMNKSSILPLSYEKVWLCFTHDLRPGLPKADWTSKVCVAQIMMASAIKDLG